MSALPEHLRWPVTHNIVAVLLGQDQPIDVQLRWKPADPLAVTLSFPSRCNDWIVARDVLAAGLDGPSGVGDVRVRPTSHATISIELSSPDGYARFLLKTEQLRDFLAETVAQVPLEEPLDIDDELTALLSGEAA